MFFFLDATYVSIVFLGLLGSSLAEDLEHFLVKFLLETEITELLV